MKAPRATPAPLPVERKRAHELAVYAREVLHGYNPPRTSADWLRIASRAHEAAAHAAELDALARRAARMLAAEEAGQ